MEYVQSFRRRRASVIIHNKTAGIFCFTLVLVMFQACSICIAEAALERSLPSCRLSVSFNLKENLLRGQATITAPEAGAAVATGNLRITSATLDGSPAGYRAKDNLFTISSGQTLEIRYEKSFKGERGAKGELENPGVVSSGEVSERGVSLTGNWYPAINGLAYYELTAAVPRDFTAISEADEVTERETPTGRQYSFHFAHPVAGIDLVAGAYRETRDAIDGIDIYAYFFPEDASLAANYIEHAKKYFRLYNELLVPYPYRRFSIVENILPTGLSMPTFTLLGREIVRLPFIPETSLGHEITHQWFGNYVYADFQKGNWLEAITTYLSDHLYEEQKGRGWEYRKNILVEFQSYVTPDKDFPLRAFVERTGFSSAAIGYGKGAMLFHMLETLIGRDTFYNSLRRLISDNKFKLASWSDVERPFEQESGKDLGWFFSQWLDRKGVPSFEVRDPSALVLKGIPSASFEFVQKGEPYKIALSAIVTADKGEVKQTLNIEKDRQYFNVAASGNPLKLVFDEDYDVMRTLDPSEFPPVIARLLGDEKRLVVYPKQEKSKYAALIDIFKGEGFAVKEQREVNDKDIQSSSLLILGSESPVLKRLFGMAGEKMPGFILRVRNNPLNALKVAAYAYAESQEDANLAAEKIFHYGKYTLIRFEKGRNVAKEIAETNRGIVFNLDGPIAAVELGKTPNLKDITGALREKPLLLIGERHPHYEDHKVELNVIMDLFRNGKKFAIGMEMFQRPYQKAIDGYLSGALDEREFLSKTEYFKRWGYDYNLYREIIEFARAAGIPIIALNQKSEIMDKVAVGGLDALSPEEIKEIPRSMDLSDEEYKKRLKSIYEDHPGKMTFENFYESQILWDETMAHSASLFLEEHPDYHMVVLAGAEHVMYGSGIPSRIRRRTGENYVILINGIFDKDIGTYILFPAPLKPPFTAKLGVTVKELNGMVLVSAFTSDSAALKAGLKEGDIINSVDGWRIQTVNDIKIALFDKVPGQTVSVIVTRKRFLIGTREITFHVSL